MTVALKNKIPLDIIDQLIEYYLSSVDLAPLNERGKMVRLTKPWEKGPAKELLSPILESYLNLNTNYGDNYFCHMYPYMPHSDYDTNDTWQLVIPLKLWNQTSQQNFIVFDQAVKHKGIIFCDPGHVHKFKFNEMQVGGVTKEDVDLITYNEIDNEFYDTHLRDDNLSERSKEIFWGMSGNAYPWTPGNIIIFDSRQLHCTANMKCDRKLGLALRFKK